MANLFSEKMAAIFDAMYQTFINYDEEYEFFNGLIKEHKGQSILEIGSGTGNLAKRFCNNNQDYKGLDSSLNMIAIAQEKNKNCTFIHGDMRNFKLQTPVDTILITGRSTSYLANNEDITETFESVYKNLNSDGVFIFDIIDANRFIPFIKQNKTIVHKASYKGINYIRESEWETTPFENFLLDWNAKYYKITADEKEILSEEFSTVRVFTLNEVQIFLYLNNFEILEIIDRKTYAYDTYVIVAKKRE